MRLIVALLLFAGGILPSCHAQDQPAPSAGRFAERNPRYRIQTNDTVEVQFRYTPEFNFTAVIQPDGFVTSQIAGDVHIAGLTLAEASASIAKSASARLKDPEVSIALKDFVKPQFIVSGEVNHPGTFELRGQVGILQAIATGGGLKDSAKRTQVVLIRRANADYAEVKTFDVKKLMAPGQINEDTILRPGDTIVVPRNRISRIEPYLHIASLGLYGLALGIP